MRGVRRGGGTVITTLTTEAFLAKPRVAKVYLR